MMKLGLFIRILYEILQKETTMIIALMSLCLFFPAVDGVWADWSHWSCDVSCGTGTRTRTRSCTNPPPTHGGDDCQGPSQETSECTLIHCPGEV